MLSLGLAACATGGGGNGVPVIGGAKDEFRTAIEGELKGCHA